MTGGLTEKEQEVMKLLCEAREKYLDLGAQHPADIQEFESAFHRLQAILAIRIVRRKYPGYWKVFNDGANQP